MSARDARVAVATIAVVLLAGVALFASGIVQTRPLTSGGGGPRIGDFISVPTAAPIQRAEDGSVVCHGALLEGELIASSRSVLAVGVEQGESVVALWPNGFGGRLSDVGVELLNTEGDVIAQTGDHIRVGGGWVTSGGTEGFEVCPRGIEVKPADP